MFDEKSYMWFLGELFKSKLKLKILDIAFCKADHIEVIYFTDNDGTVSVAPNRSLLIRDVLRKFVSNRTNGLEKESSPSQFCTRHTPYQRKFITQATCRR